VAAMKVQAADDRKLRELILHVCLRSEDDPWLGRTKLFKLLFFIDVEALKQLGRTVTGQEYEKQQYGPIPRHGWDAFAALQDAGDIATFSRRIAGYSQDRAFALRSPDLSLFDSAELLLIESIIDQYKRFTGKQISMASHEFLGWDTLNYRESVPLGATLFSDRNLTSDERAYATRLAELPELQGVIPGASAS
jgi:hypothetical protein